MAGISEVVVVAAVAARVMREDAAKHSAAAGVPTIFVKAASQLEEIASRLSLASGKYQLNWEVGSMVSTNWT
jgi:hypothetical protein